MTHKHIRGGILLLLFSIISCVTPKSTKNQHPIIEIERTPCFGKCPVYILKIYENGNIDYNGVKNVARKGKETIQLNSKQHKNLIKQFESLPFSDYKTEYGKQIRDITYIYVTYKGKKIKMTLGSAPKELLNQIHYLEKELRLLN